MCTPSQIPINTTLNKRNSPYFNYCFQFQKIEPIAGRESQLYKTSFPLIIKQSNYSCKCQPPKKSILFAQSPTQKQLTKLISKSNFVSHQNLDSNKTILMDKIIMSPKKRINRVSFGDSSSTKESPTTPLLPKSPATSSNTSTPLTHSPKTPTVDNLITKFFSKFLIPLLTSNDAVLKEVCDCILNNNEERPHEINPYIHLHRRELHVRSGDVYIDETVAIPDVLRQAFIDILHASHPDTWGMLCMATHCWWP